MNQDLINQLHQDYCQCYRERDALEQKWRPEAIHKTRLKSAQRDKGRWYRLTMNINALRDTLGYYGYGTEGPDLTLVKETAE